MRASEVILVSEIKTEAGFRKSSVSFLLKGCLKRHAKKQENMQNIFKMEEIMHNKLTESDIKKMQEEIEYRKLVVRKEALEDVKEARAQGDLSENFEYYAAKKFKNKNESRIRFLERMIKTAEVVSDESAADEVGMNNKVEVWFEEDDETETYKIVTTMRQDSLKGLISGESPLGKALLGHKIGDRVFVEIGGGDGYYVVIRSIDKSAGDDDELRSF